MADEARPRPIEDVREISAITYGFRFPKRYSPRSSSISSPILRKAPPRPLRSQRSLVLLKTGW
jgi:hypothetical protein